MTDAPLRIWATYGGDMMTISTVEGRWKAYGTGDAEYHLHTREALAQSPIVQAMIAEAVEVRPLEWVCVDWSSGDGVEGENDCAWEAETGIAGQRYRIDWMTAGPDGFWLYSPITDKTTKHPSLSVAKEAAQAAYADFAAVIRRRG